VVVIKADQRERLSIAAGVLVVEHGALEECLETVFFFDGPAEVLELGVFAVELDSVGEAVWVVERVAEVDLGVLVLLYGLNHPRQLQHYLLHPLQQLVIALVAGLVRQPLHYRGLAAQHPRKVQVF